MARLANLENQVELVRAARSGDREAFAELAAHFLRPLYSFCYFKTRNREDAEDAVQTAFLTALERLKKLRDERLFGPWLFSIALNAWLSERRKYRFEVPMPEEGEIPDPPDPRPLASTILEEQWEQARKLVEQRQRAQLAWRLLWGPSEEKRDAVFFRYWLDLGYEEIAEALGEDITAGTVRKRVFDAIESMRKEHESMRKNETRKEGGCNT